MTESGAQPKAEPRDLRGWTLAVAGLLVAVAVWRALTFGAPYGGDWAQYMSHAKALAEGRDFGDIGYLFSPYAWQIGPPQYPPGLALVMAPSVALFGDSLVVPRLIMHALLGVLLVAAYRYFSQHGSRELALGATAMLGVGFLLANTANIVGSDIGMCALVWCALLMADAEPAWDWKRALAIGLLGAAALNFRIAAASLVPALVLWALLKRREVRLRPWLVAGGWGAMLVFVMVAFDPGEQAAEAVRRELPSAPVLGSDAPDRSLGEQFVSRMFGRLRTYRVSASQAFLYPSPVPVLNRLYHVVAVPLTVVGLWGWARRSGLKLGLVFGVVTACMLMVLPVWSPRYAWVLMPFACYGLLAGASRVLRLRRSVSERGSYLAAAGIALVVAVGATLTTAVRTDLDLPDDAGDWRAAGDVLREMGSDVRAATNRPRMLTWYTGVPAAGIPDADLEPFLGELARLEITAIVASTRRNQEHQFQSWLRLREQHPDVFPLVDRIGAIEVYGVVRR